MFLVFIYFISFRIKNLCGFDRYHFCCNSINIGLIRSILFDLVTGFAFQMVSFSVYHRKCVKFLSKIAFLGGEMMFNVFIIFFFFFFFFCWKLCVWLLLRCWLLNKAIYIFWLCKLYNKNRRISHRSRIFWLIWSAGRWIKWMTFRYSLLVRARCAIVHLCLLSFHYISWFQCYFSYVCGWLVSWLAGCGWLVLFNSVCFYFKVRF